MEERKARIEIIEANKRFTGLSEFLVESWRDWVKRK